MSEQTKTTIFRTIVIILIIIILLLVFFNRNNVGKMNYYPIPTGNVDFFDIDVHTSLEYDELHPDKLPNASGKEYKVTKKYVSINGQQVVNIPSYNPTEDTEVLGKVFVDDKNGDFLYQQNLAIFENSAFNYETKIAPGVSNTYHFVVHNSSNIPLQYYIEMYEESEYDVNLKYRLKRENQYVVGDDSTWVTADQLKTAFKNIGISSSDSYSLDWKWEYEDGVDDKDTLAGEKMTSDYKLNIRVHFEE